jgi:anti-sigma factor ChrR (cupin superfamily)
LNNGSIPPELLELAALYALDSLESPEREAFERELAGNPALRAEVDTLREAAGWLGAAAPASEPSSGLRGRLMAEAIPAGRGRPEVLLEGDGLLILSSSRIPWKPHRRIPGVEVRTLKHDRETGIVSSLLRIQAGSSLTRHRHAGEEELFVLEGQVEINGIPMGPGDYCRADPGSVHQPSRAITDAVILVRSSLHDEYE